MDLAKAKRFNQGLDADGVALVARALKLTPAQVATWGDTVLAGVASWQARNGLAADGMVGPKTATKMAASEGRVSAPRIIPNLISEAAAQFPDHRFGSDISLWNNEIDPSKFGGCSFVIIKATEGDFTDPLYLQHRATMAKAAGVKLGNYHLPRMVDGKKGDWINLPIIDPVKQAKYAAAVAKANPAEFLEAMDMEPDSIGDPNKKPRFFSALLRAYGAGKIGTWAPTAQEKAAKWVGDWLDVFENESGTEAVWYGSPRLMKEGGEPLRQVIGSRLRWVAAYWSAPRLPVSAVELLPDHWELGTWDIWQCRGSDNKETPKDEGGKCLGIGGGRKDCDQNVLNPASSLMARLVA
jgi:hypothetical protein